MRVLSHANPHSSRVAGPGIGILLVMCCLGAAMSASQVQQPVFRSGVELVTIDVVATTRDGRPVHNLKAEDFELFEDGVRQEIRTFRF